MTKRDRWLRYLGPSTYFDTDAGQLFRAGGEALLVPAGKTDELLTFPDHRFEEVAGPDPEPPPPSEEKP